MIAIGLMSGTSMDGVDAAIVRIDGCGSARARLEPVAFTCLGYAPELRQRLAAGVDGAALTACELGALDVAVGHAFADAVEAVRSATEAAGLEIDVIGSHGQTLAHAPGDGVTVQIGSAAVIAERTGIAVIHDFRARDVAAGGQGAPLVPFVDHLLFARSDRTVGALNVGGIANLTVLPAGQDLAAVRAFDTGPGNMVIDAVVSLLTGGRERRDPGGARGASGTVREDLLARWLTHPYFAQQPPKSTGGDAFGPHYAERLLAEARERGLADDDVLATVTALSVRSIAGAVSRTAVEQLVVSGGGVHNATLMDGLRGALPSVEVATSRAHGIDPDAKEAIAFAVLAWAHTHGVPAGLPAVTGARGARVLGAAVPGNTA